MLKDSIENYNSELAKYLPESLLNQMKLVSDFQIPNELMSNLSAIQSLDADINRTNQQLNAQVFKLEQDEEPQITDFSSYYKPQNVHKVNMIIDPELLNPDSNLAGSSISFNPVLMA